jgi:hypothetical protein
MRNRWQSSRYRFIFALPPCQAIRIPGTIRGSVEFADPSRRLGHPFYVKITTAAPI